MYKYKHSHFTNFWNIYTLLVEYVRTVQGHEQYFLDVVYNLKQTHQKVNVTSKVFIDLSIPQ